MDPGCIFGLEYQPPNVRDDPVAQLHIENCADCQEQVALV